MDRCGLSACPKQFDDAQDETIVECMQRIAGWLLKDRLARLRETVRQALRQKHADLDRQQIRALRRSEALHRAVLNSLAALIAVLDRNGTIIAVNEAWSRFAAENGDPTAARTGVGVNYLEVCRRMALSGHMLAAQVLNGIQAVLDGSQPYFALEYPTHFLTEKRWYSLSVLPLADESGGATLSRVDVTARKLAEDELRMLHSAVEQSASSVIITDVQGNIEYVNPHFTQVTGYTADEVMGKNPRILKSGEMAPQVYRQMWDTLTAGGVWRGELHNQKKNGELFWELASISAIKDAQGDVTHFLAVKEDVTERKRWQEEFTRSEVLRVALSKEREILDLKQRFISMVSHDLRSPLTVINTMRGLLADHFDRLSPERRLKYLQPFIRRSNTWPSCSTMCSRFDAVQAGKLESHPSPINLEAFCRDVFEQMQFSDTVGHEFVFMAEGDFTNVSLDEKILRHILINLLSNAIKYSPGGGEIRLQLSRSERDVTLRISDQGIGIPVEDQARNL